MLYLNFIIYNKRKKQKRRLGNCPYLNAYKTSNCGRFYRVRKHSSWRGIGVLRQARTQAYFNHKTKT